VKCIPGGSEQQINRSEEGNRDGLGTRSRTPAEEAAGKVREATRRATDNRSLAAEGKADQASANIKQASEKARDAVRNAAD
jgi:uncharacterized protein YjbJ (UPF0337 family)